MDERAVETIEKAMDAAAAILFAAAVGFVAAMLAGAFAAGASAVIGFGLCLGLLSRLAPEHPRFALPEFTPAQFDEFEPDELVLTDSQRLQPSEEVLELDDILAQIGPDSRVVRLFDRAAMPTPGELKARIDRHLDEEPASPPDASQALFDALAELRRSLA